MHYKLAVDQLAATDSGEDIANDTGRMASRFRPAQPTPDVDVSGLKRAPSAKDPRKRESESLFRTTFERAVIGIAHTSPEGRWLRFNQRLCTLLGYSRTELAARNFQDVTHSDDLDDSVVRLHRLLAGELDADEWDKRYVRKDGGMVWAHLTVTTVRTPTGEPDYFITMVQDITERKRLEEERAQALERERAARRDAEMARAQVEETNAQLQAIQALTDTALSHLTLDSLLDELLNRVTAVMGVDHSSILLLEADGQTLVARAARGPAEEMIRRLRLVVGQRIPGRIAARREPVIVDMLSDAELDEVPPALREHLRSVAGVPLLVDDHALHQQEDSAESRREGHLEVRLVGVLIVGSATPNRFKQADVQLLQRAADRIAMAIDHARHYAAEQSARQQAETALARAQASEAQATERAERLNTILETMADGVAVYDAEGHSIQPVNRAYRELLALGRGPAEYETLTTVERARLVQVRDATTGELIPFERTPVGRALRGEVVTGPSADVRLRAFDGRELEVNACASPLREADGRIIGAVLVLRDLTERNRLARERAAARADELAVRELSRQMEAFLAVAAHDLRTPLTAVVGYLDLAAIRTGRLAHLAAAGHMEDPALAQQIAAVLGSLDDAGQGAERLTRLLTRLFDLAAVRADKLELRRVPCDLATLVREQVAAQRMAAPGRAIRLRGPAKGQPIPVEADVDRIGQVVTNYLTNALKYAPADRPVHVSVEVMERAAPGASESQACVTRMARVAVRDRGPGLPEVERIRIWERFHRAPGITVRRGAPSGAEGGGMGLGLYICKAIVEAHGGHVGVESAVGAGSTFWFTLPLDQIIADTTGTGLFIMP